MISRKMLLSSVMLPEGQGSRKDCLLRDAFRLILAQAVEEHEKWNADDGVDSGTDG